MIPYAKKKRTLDTDKYTLCWNVDGEGSRRMVWEWSPDVGPGMYNSGYIDLIRYCSKNDNRIITDSTNPYEYNLLSKDEAEFKP